MHTANELFIPGTAVKAIQLLLPLHRLPHLNPFIPTLSPSSSQKQDKGGTVIGACLLQPVLTILANKPKVSSKMATATEHASIIVMCDRKRKKNIHEHAPPGPTNQRVA